MFLGVDIGTSGVKAVILSPRGALMGQGHGALAVSRLQANWSEQDPADWWRACDSAIAALDPALRRAVRAIGLTGQMHGAVLLDAHDAVLRPAILWNDGRSAAECHELEQRVPTSRAITGNIAMPGFTAPKLLWVARHEPEVFAAVRTVLLPKDYIRLLMTGEKASDMSDSAGTLWLDVARRAWSDEMLAAAGLNTTHMPRLYEGSEQTGMLRKDIAAAWGMDAVPVAAGGGDNAAGAVGIGVVAPGDALLSLGTSGVTFTVTDAFRPNPAGAVHAFCHCLPATWHQMAVHLSAAACLDWGARQLGIDGPAALLALAETSTAGTGPEVFLPYLSGERTPHNDPTIRAAWLDCDSDTTPARLASAILEGVAFAFADGIDALRNAASPVPRARVIGGGARSPYWGRIIATAIDAELEYLDGGEVGPALGAAHLARIALTGEAPATVCQPPRVLATVAPDPALAARLAPKFDRFRAAYRALATVQE